MFKIIGIMALGVLIGIALHKIKLGWLNRAIEVSVALLLLLMGISVGSNSMIMDNLETIGADALIITIGAVLGSALMALLIYIKVFKRR